MVDNIARHRDKLLQPYVRSPNAQGIIASARILAKIALATEEMRWQHRKKMLHDAIWYCTEADGKWNTKYKSKVVLDLAQFEPGSLVRINHEHVVTRKNLVNYMLEHRVGLLEDVAELHRLLDTAVACIVTVDQHAELLQGTGWERYANIEVYDTETVPPRLVRLDIGGIVCPDAQPDPRLRRAMAENPDPFSPPRSRGNDDVQRTVDQGPSPE